MRQLTHQLRQSTGIENVAIVFIFILFVALRLYSWSNVRLLEDTDSVALIKVVRLFLAFDIQSLINMSADYTPLYPAVSALFSALIGSDEAGARFCSFFFSVVTFFALVGIGRKIATPLELIIGLALFAVSPFLVRFSYSVLTEPTYVATVYIGFLLFWSKLKEPRWWTALALAAIFAAAFLNRIEGVLYLAAIPAIQGAHYVFKTRPGYDLRQLLLWSGLYVLTFVLISAPQVWRVSELMGSPSLNGRQTWSLILNSVDQGSYEEKIYGLDYSPSQTNLHYLREHQEARSNHISKTGLPGLIKSNIKLVYQNLQELMSYRLDSLIGPYGLPLFLIGLLALYHKKLHFELFLIAAFLALGLAAPLLHNVAVRHIAVIGPIMILIQGIGILALAEQAIRFFNIKFIGNQTLAILIVIMLFQAAAKPLYRELRYPHGSRSAYFEKELAKPIAIVNAIEEQELGRPANIMARKDFLSLYTESPDVALPYTDYPSLVRYARLNKVDLLFLERARLTDHPFIEQFYKAENTPDFELIYADTVRRRWDIRLYRFNAED